MTGSRIHVTAARERAEALFRACEALFEEQGLPLALTEIDEAAGLFELSIYADDADAVRTALAPLLEAEESIGEERLPDIDWVAKSLEDLKPVRAGRFLVHGSHDRDARRPSDIAIEIEAGMAFGTGHHGTTAGCLMMIDEIVRRENPRNALDLGTGSAVLAIGLARLKRLPVLATDIDPGAVRVARDNIRLNGVESLVHAVTASGFDHPLLHGRRFDLIVANILAGPLMRLAPDMALHLAPGGSLILSGILVGQRWRVLAAYRGQGFRHVRTRRIGEWVTLHLKR